MKKLYIAYGSNMDVDQMADRCPDATLIGQGEIADYQLMFKGSGTGNYATVEPQEGSKVPVLIWEISAADEASLDHYEGWPDFYYKMNIPVAKDGNGEIMGIVYIMHEERKFGLPDAGYYDKIADAYEEYGFDKAILKGALEFTKAHM